MLTIMGSIVWFAWSRGLPPAPKVAIEPA